MSSIPHSHRLRLYFQNIIWLVYLSPSDVIYTWISTIVSKCSSHIHLPSLKCILPLSEWILKMQGLSGTFLFNNASGFHCSQIKRVKPSTWRWMSAMSSCSLFFFFLINLPFYYSYVHTTLGSFLPPPPLPPLPPTPPLPFPTSPRYLAETILPLSLILLKFLLSLLVNFYMVFWFQCK
jgi:hypothetical protein